MKTIGEMTADELEALHDQFDCTELQRRDITHELLSRYRELYRYARDAAGRGGLESADARGALRRFLETLPWEPFK